MCRRLDVPFETSPNERKIVQQISTSKCPYCGKPLHFKLKSNRLTLDLFFEQQHAKELEGISSCAEDGIIRTNKLRLHLLKDPEIIQIIANLHEINKKIPTKESVLNSVQSAWYLYCAKWGLSPSIFNSLKDGFTMQKCGPVSEQLHSQTKDLTELCGSMEIVKFDKSYVEKIKSTLDIEDINCMREAVLFSKKLKDSPMKLWIKANKLLPIRNRTIVKEDSGRLVEVKDYLIVEVSEKLKPKSVITVKKPYWESVAASLKDAQICKHIERSQTRLVEHKDTVGSHSWGVTDFAIHAACFLKEQGENVDFSKIIHMAHYHDFAESRIGDSPGYAKNKNDKEKEFKTNIQMTKDLPLYLRRVREAAIVEYEKRLTIEARIVKLSDSLDLLRQTLVNNHTLEFYEVGLNVLNDIEIQIKKDRRIKLVADYLLLCLEGAYPHIKNLYKKKYGIQNVGKESQPISQISRQSQKKITDFQRDNLQYNITKSR